MKCGAILMVRHERELLGENRLLSRKAPEQLAKRRRKFHPDQPGR
jgi:hypothetical protein